MQYHYVLISDPYQIKSSEYIDELITLLYEGTADFISDGQRIEIGLPKNYFQKLRRVISQYEERVPLYDIIYNHIYLIHRDNIYPRIYLDNYRFIDSHFYQNLLKVKNPTKTDKENLRLLAYYDLDVLDQTYMKLFYKSFVLNSFITTCRRPSFASGMEHISPYYNINELYYLAYDWNLTEKTTLSESEINHFCQKISKYDISAETLLSHQIYIYDTHTIGLVKHYSLFGSYYMNVYLRKNQYFLHADKNYDDVIRNLYLENQIKIMIHLICHAPIFTESHTVYRFIERDDYMNHLKPGDVYRDSGFMSTTRNPFYYKENYSFGYILVKIKLPKNVKGVGLSVEAYSNFPSEEEIILPPTSEYRLDNLMEASDTSQFHDVFNLRVLKKYEFTWIGNDFAGCPLIDIKMPDSYIPELQEIYLPDLLDDENIKYLNISDRLKYFRDTFGNINNQFSTIVGNNKYVFNFEAYNSNTVYKPFFYYEVTDGIMITTANPKYGNINILMEMGPEIHVNYYFKFSVTDPSIVVDLNQAEWMEWLSLFAYIVGSRNVVIHSNYVLHYDKSDTIKQKQMQTRYTFSQNIYLYMKYKKKMYVFSEVTPNFDYYQLDYLFGVPISEIAKPSDRDELYRVAQDSESQNVGELYLFIVERFPKLIKTFEEKMDLLFEPENNPFKHIMYTLDAWVYLYNRNLIRNIPAEKEFAIRKGSFKKLIGDKKIPKFKNRLRTFLMAG